MMASLWVERLGHVLGKPLIFLHGWGMHSDVWQPILPYFERRYAVTLIDLPGHGHSQQVSWNKNYDQLINELRILIPPQSVVVGWSLGGLLAARLKYQFPQMIDRVVCLAASPCFVNHREWEAGMHRATFDQFDLMVKKNSVEALQYFSGLIHFGDESAKKLTKYTRDLLFNYGVPHHESLVSALDILKNNDARSEWKIHARDMLVCLGKNDALISSLILERWLKMNSFPCVFNIESSGHAPFLSNPEQVATVINDFVSRHD